MTESEFIDQFVAYMLFCAGTEFADGGSIEEYAREIAPTYWANPGHRADGPEPCVEADMDCWE